MASGDTKPVELLRHGDEVATVSTSVRPGTSKVFFFGHREHNATSPFTCIATASRRLCLSPDHYILTSEGGLDGAVQLRARSVKTGMTVWVESASGMHAASVVSVEEEWRKGLYNPYLVDADHLLVVDGVVASTHSYWFLDGIVPDTAAWFVPSVYDKALSPARALYRLMGPAWAEDVQKRLDLEGAATQEGSLASLVEPFAMVFYTEAAPI
eukprot:CAMPEP_0117055984 /NCGR_PEP_ID=MMETSP0472-20121206/38838_1 /TAXON_ID=693140 ORGANISM="Tiarina fusus, Strain LIS" /NCGR_SAMPLE_ID=MMETSP0472 /ASSEMBLY_ACC=CAM_ASM_000603 /LENGTH=211 /DNA_ID=CAMNT_0004772247 /DNA_START=30 /DNA_END=662 /DNA_ORIENTATION=-